MVKYKVLASTALLSLLVTPTVWSADYSSSNWTGSDNTTLNGGDTLSAGDSLTIESGDTLDVNGDAIKDADNNLTINVYGSVIADDGSNEGIQLDGTDAIINIFSSGSVTAADNAIEVATSATANNVINVHGTVTGSDYGIDLNQGEGNTVTIHAGGTVSGTNDAIYVGGDNNTIYVYGTVESSSGDAIDLEDNSADSDGSSVATVHIYGSVKATSGGASDYAVETDGGASVYLYEGGIVYGGFNTSANAVASNLTIDVGSARSYVLKATDDGTSSWSVTDADSRTVVTTSGASGAAKAAGIGNLETADEALYNRNISINQSLSRFAKTIDKTQPWADIYGVSSRRSSGETLAPKFKHSISGVTVVNPLANNYQLFVGLQKANLDISENIQKIDSTSISAGLQKQLQADGTTGRLMLSHNKYASSQEVLDSASANGYTTYTGDYSSLGLTLGINRVQKFDNLTFTLDGALAHERIDNYKETATFTWNKRNLTQAIFSASGEWTKTNADKTWFVNGGVSARSLLSGKQATYMIDSTNATFSGGNHSEVIATFGAGLDYQLEQDGKATFEVLGSYSNRKTATLSAVLRIESDF